VVLIARLFFVLMKASVSMAREGMPMRRAREEFHAVSGEEMEMVQSMEVVEINAMRRACVG